MVVHCIFGTSPYYVVRMYTVLTHSIALMLDKVFIVNSPEGIHFELTIEKRQKGPMLLTEEVVG